MLMNAALWLRPVVLTGGKEVIRLSRRDSPYYAAHDSFPYRVCPKEVSQMRNAVGEAVGSVALSLPVVEVPLALQ